MSTAPSASRRASRLPTTRATRSTKPRSSTGVGAPTASPRPPRPAGEQPITSNIERRRRTDVSDSENPVIPAPTAKPHRPSSNQDWWPNQLDLSVLHQHGRESNPMGEDFD